MSSSSGHLSGTDTVDKVPFNATQNATVSYTVSGSGSGNNTLTFKAQQQKAAGGWSTLVEKKLAMPSDSENGSFKVRDWREGGTESLRYRFSRKIGTKAISWDVSW